MILENILREGELTFIERLSRSFEELNNINRNSRMGWFKRIKKGVTTETNQKKEIPEGLWYKCPKCKTIITSEQHHLQYYVCNN